MPADAQQHVLREAGVGVAVVEARGDHAPQAVVLGHVGVEQEQRHAPDVDPPDLRVHVLVADADADHERGAVRRRDDGARDALGIGRHPVLLLPPRGVDALAEVPAPVHEPDRDERQPAVGRLLEDVAREGPEAARVDRQRLVHRVLGTEERHRVVGGHGPGRGGRAELGGHDLLERRDARQQLVVVRGPCERGRGGLLQQPHRIAPARAPPRRVDRAEDARPARQPGPAVVVREPGQAGERFRDAGGEVGGRPGEVLRSATGSALQVVRVFCGRHGAWHDGRRRRPVRVECCAGPPLRLASASATLGG